MEHEGRSVKLAPYTVDLRLGVGMALAFAAVSFIGAVLITRPHFLWNYFSALLICVVGFGAFFLWMLRFLRPSRWLDSDEVAPMPPTANRMTREELKTWRLRQLSWMVPVLAIGVATLDASMAGAMGGLALLGAGWRYLLCRYEAETGGQIYYMQRKPWSWKSVKPRYFIDPPEAYDRGGRGG